LYIWKDVIDMSYHTKKTGCRMGQYLDTKTGKCKALTYKKGWKNVEFPLNKKQTLDKLFAVQGQIERRGSSFDTSAGRGQREWSLDWSLKGPLSANDIIKSLRAKKLNFKVKKTADQVLDENAKYYLF
jgi:hypothetical protein